MGRAGDEDLGARLEVEDFSPFSLDLLAVRRQDEVVLYVAGNHHRFRFGAHLDEALPVLFADGADRSEVAQHWAEQSIESAVPGNRFGRYPPVDQQGRNL